MTGVTRVEEAVETHLAAVIGEPKMPFRLIGYQKTVSSDWWNQKVGFVFLIWGGGAARS